MLKKIAMASSRREMAQRDSVELWETEGASAPCTSCPSPAHPGPIPGPSPAHPRCIPSPSHPHPAWTHIDAGGIEGALAGDRGEGDVGDGAGGQQHPALVAQGQPDGHEQPQQAAQAAQAAAGAQGEQRPLLREGEKRQPGMSPPQSGDVPSSGRTPDWGVGALQAPGEGLQPPGCWERGWGCLRGQQGRGNGTAAGQRLHRRWSARKRSEVSEEQPLGPLSLLSLSLEAHPGDSAHLRQ